MKKIYAVIAAAIFFVGIATAQQSYYTTEASNNTGKTGPIIYNASSQMAIIGNPARNAIVLQVSNPNNTKYELVLYSSTGEKVTSLLYDHPGGVSTKTIYVSDLKPGFYYLDAINKNEAQTLKLVVQQ
jgi:hypothetical protein